MSDQNQADSEGQDWGDLPDPVPIRQANCDLPKPCSDGGHANKKRHSALEWLTFVVNFATLAVLIFYTIFTYRMWEATRDAARAASDGAAASLAAADASKAAAQAATDANRLAAQSVEEQQRATILDHRAWLIIPKATASLSEFFRTGGTRVEISAKNVGATTAFRMAADARWLPIGANCETPSAKLPGYHQPVPRPVHGLDLPPGDSTTKLIPYLVIGVIQDTAERERIVLMGKPIYVRAIIEYYDVLGPKRVTEYCWAFSESGAQNELAIVKTRFE